MASHQAGDDYDLIVVNHTDTLSFIKGELLYPIGDMTKEKGIDVDSIIMGNGRVKSVPAIEADHEDAILFHEAAIGKIAGEQLIKLQTLGLTPEEAEAEILEDFLS